jgi:hypothetical protein
MEIEYEYRDFELEYQDQVYVAWTTITTTTCDFGKQELKSHLM